MHHKMVLVGRRLFHTFRLKQTLLHYLSTWQGWQVRHCWRFNARALWRQPCDPAHFLEQVAVACTARRARTF